jgi:hypothetical protein
VVAGAGLPGGRVGGAGLLVGAQVPGGAERGGGLGGALLGLAQFRDGLYQGGEAELIPGGGRGGYPPPGLTLRQLLKLHLPPKTTWFRKN